MNKVKFFNEYHGNSAALQTQVDTWLEKNDVTIVSVQTDIAANNYGPYIF